MPDPFMALRAPVVPVDPDPIFAARLRDRLARALDLPRGITVSDLTLERGPSAERARIRQGDIGYVSLWVPDVERAAAFFATVLGWSYHPGSSGQGRQVVGPEPSHGLHGGHQRSTLFLCFAVDDLDAAIERVRAAGGATSTPRTEAHGRIADCVDDQGSAFALYQPPGGDLGVRPAENGTRPGDLGYITIEVPDSARTRAFYQSVLGWRFAPGRVGDGWNVEQVVPMTGMSGGHPQATTVPMYRVDDIGAAVTRIRGAGGTAPEPDRQFYGLQALCVDDQGTRFYVWQP